MRLLIKIGLFLLAFGISYCSYALIGNNQILTPDYSICAGAKSPRIVGSTPTGGPVSFLWIVSTTDSATGFVAATGVNDGIHYTPLQLSANSWFRRIAILGSEADTSFAVKVTLLTHPHPKAGYSVNNPVQCFTGHHYVFTDTSTVSSGSIVLKVWDLGDFTILQGINSPTKTYGGPFNYNVKLVVTTDHGCKDSMIRTMSVLEEPKAIIACDSMEQCFKGNAFLLLDGSTITMGSITARWSFDDGTDSIAQSLVKSYAAPGVYAVKLVAASDYNCKDSVTQLFTVHPDPKAGFLINDDVQCFAGNEFLFTDTSTINSEWLKGRFWDFGNGDTSSAIETAVSYSHSSVFAVKMVAISEYGCTDSLIRNVLVNEGLSAGFTLNNDSQCLAGNHFEVSDTSDSDNRVWYWDDMGGPTTTNAAVSFLTAGAHTLMLVSTGNQGCSDSATQTVIVHPQPQANSILGNSSVIIGQETRYTIAGTEGSVYNWLAEGGSIVQANNTDTIDLLWGNNPGNGWLKVLETSKFGCAGDTGVLNVVINPVPDSLDTDKDTIYIPAQFSSDSFRIYCNTNWVITAHPSWISIPALQGSGDSTITFTGTVNNGPPRSATIGVLAGTASKNVLIIQDRAVGLNEVSRPSQWMIYPNPSTGIFTLKGNRNEPVKVVLFEYNGRILDQRILSSDHLLDYSFLPNGIYMLELQDTEGPEHIRVIIFR